LPFIDAGHSGKEGWMSASTEDAPWRGHATVRPRELAVDRLRFFLLTAICAIPAWLVDYFPSQDGPIHLWILHLLHHYGASDGTLVQAFLEPNFRLEPNLGFYLVAYPLTLVFDDRIAERIFLTLLAFAFCYGARYALSLVRQEGSYLSYLAIPATYHYFIHMGFFNYALGVAAFLPAFALCASAYQGNHARRLAVILVSSLTLACIHLVAFVMLAVAIVTYGVVVELARQPQLLAWRTPLRLAQGPLFTLGLALIPGTLLFLAFTGEHGVTPSPHPGLRSLFWRLTSLEFLISYDIVERHVRSFAMIALLVTVVAVVARNAIPAMRRDSRVAALLAALVAFAVLYFFPPVSSAGVPLSPRLVPYLFLFLLLFLASFETPAWFRRGVVLVCVLLVTTDAAVRSIQYRALSAEIEDIVEAGRFIEEGSTLLALRMAAHVEEPRMLSPLQIGHRPDYLLHTGAYLAIGSNAVYLRSPLMSPTHYAYFPFRFRPEMDPFAHLGTHIEGRDPPVAFDAFAEATGSRTRYLLISGAVHMDKSDGRWESSDILKELDRHYSRVWISATGKHELYALSGRAPGLPESQIPEPTP
jgi:hypothetical protein